MKQGWEKKKLGDLVNIKTGRLDSNAMVSGGKYPFFTCSREVFAINKYAFDCEAILLAGNNASGDFNVKHYKGKFNAYQRTYVITVNDDKRILYSYLNHQLINHLKKFKEQSVGANTKFLKIGMIQGMEITLPPVPQQKRIVAIVDEAFAAIDKAKDNTEKNLKNAKQLFESYLQSVFEKKGEKWEEKRFEELCKLTRGHNPPKSKFITEPKEGYVRFYQIRDGWADDYDVYVPETPQLHMVEPSEILMVAYRHIGKVFRGVSGAFNVALCKISNKDRKKLDDDYLFYIIPTDIVRGELMKRSERSLIPSMSVEHLKKIIIPLPALKEQKIIVRKLNALSAETKRLEAVYQQKINDLEELKKSVLQKAFSGGLN